MRCIAGCWIEVFGVCWYQLKVVRDDAVLGHGGVGGVGRLTNLASEMAGEAKRGAACFMGTIYIQRR